MKKFIYIAIFFIFQSFFTQSNLYGINELESDLNKSQSFVENGVKLVYKTSLSEDDIKNSIKDKIHEKIGINISSFDNNIDFEWENINYSITVWSKEKTHISIQAINSNKKLSTKDVLDRVNNFKISSISNKIYRYSKYKILNENIEYDGVIKGNVENKENIEISNGYVSKILLEDKTKVSLAHMKYNTGNYLIIGTPMIFVTY